MKVSAGVAHKHNHLPNNGKRDRKLPKDKPPLLTDEQIIEARKFALHSRRVWRYSEAELDRFEGKAIAIKQRQSDFEFSTK